MADTGKLRPEFTRQGLFMPWPLVVSLLFALFVSGLVPLIGLWVSAAKALDRMERVEANDGRQDLKLESHAERLARIEGTK